MYMSYGRLQHAVSCAITCRSVIEHNDQMGRWLSDNLPELRIDFIIYKNKINGYLWRMSEVSSLFLIPPYLILWVFRTLRLTSAPSNTFCDWYHRIVELHNTNSVNWYEYLSQSKRCQLVPIICPKWCVTQLGCRMWNQNQHDADTSLL